MLRLPPSLWRSGSGAATGIGLLLVLLTLVLATYAVWELRREAVEGARTNAENQAYALAAHAAQVLSGSQLLLDNLAQTLQDPNASPSHEAERWGGPQTHAWLRTKRNGYRWLGMLAVVDANGRLVNQSETYPPPPVELWWQPIFRSARAGRDDSLLLSVPVATSFDGGNNFYLARRLRGPDGEFAGLLLVGLSSDYFSRFYLAQRMDRRHPEPDGSSMTLLREDLTVLARAPEDWQLLGRRLPEENGYVARGSEFAALPTEPAPPTWDSDPRNRHQVLVVMQRVDGFPVYVAVAQRDIVYLALWRRQAISIISFAAGMCLFISLAFYALVRLLRARENEMRDQARLRAVAEQASRAKSQFLATISHEVRTPLNGILGTAELLARTPLDTQQRSWTQTLLRSGRHLLGVISDVLDLSKIEAGEMGIDPLPMNPRGLVEEVHQLFSSAARAKGLRMVFDVEAGVPGCVEVDGTRLHQVLANLLSNAIKFSDRGEVRLSLRCEQFDGRRCRLRFEVSDQGIGMPAEAQARVLAPFVQADGSVARRYGGTGLGLAICDRLLALMGSALEFSSREGHGSRFWFTLDLPVCPLPVQPDEATHGVDADRYANSGAMPLDAEEPAPPEPGSAAADGLGLHVLVVEDNAVNALVVEAQLNSLGCSCEIATDGRDALHALATRHFDAVLMDCMLPVMSGYDATAAWRQQELAQELPRVPIIALTANVMASNLQRCTDCGMDDHLTKPCTRDELEATLRLWAPLRR